ncbi:MAG: P1 family peptidase [Planctomycetota bacterium]
MLLDIEWIAVWILMLVFASAAQAQPGVGDEAARVRVRELGVSPGVLPPGRWNAITDVRGVKVGHQTLIRGDDVRTGVTAIWPHGGNLVKSKVPAAAVVGNGYGKAAGFLQVQELGTIETPIVLTNTLSVGTAVEALVAWTLRQEGNENVRSVNAIVGETNDGYLNDIRGQHVRAEDVWKALETAKSGRVTEGSVGAGTGTMAFGWKGGIGTASRKLPAALGAFTVGVLVQSNFGGVLTIDGNRVGEALGRYPFRTAIEQAREQKEQRQSRPAETEEDQGSCMIVVATDAPVDSRQLERIARRALLGLARTGSYMSHGSGDFVIAFSTTQPLEREPFRRKVELLEDRALDPIFLATVEAVEEAVYNSLTMATTIEGREGHVGEAIPIPALRRALKR